MSETLNAQDIAKKLQEQLTSLSATVDTHEVSTVDEVGDGIARVSGLKSAMAGELLEFKSSDTGETVFGLAQNLDRDEVGAVLFGAVDSIKEGDECRTTGRIMDIPVSRAMLGRVVNPLGQPIDGLTVCAEALRQSLAEEKTLRKYLAQLMEITPTAANVLDYCAIVRDQALLRNVITVCEETVETASSGAGAFASPQMLMP